MMNNKFNYAPDAGGGAGALGAAQGAANQAQGAMNGVQGAAQGAMGQAQGALDTAQGAANAAQGAMDAGGGDMAANIASIKQISATIPEGPQKQQLLAAIAKMEQGQQAQSQAGLAAQAGADAGAQMKQGNIAGAATSAVNAADAGQQAVQNGLNAAGQTGAANKVQGLVDKAAPVVGAGLQGVQGAGQAVADAKSGNLAGAIQGGGQTLANMGQQIGGKAGNVMGMIGQGANLASGIGQMFGQKWSDENLKDVDDELGKEWDNDYHDAVGNDHRFGARE